MESHCAISAAKLKNLCRKRNFQGNNGKKKTRFCKVSTKKNTGTNEKMIYWQQRHVSLEFYSKVRKCNLSKRPSVQNPDQNHDLHTVLLSCVIICVGVIHVS